MFSFEWIRGYLELIGMSVRRWAIMDWGVTYVPDANSQKHVHLTNSLAFILALCIAPYALLYASLQWWTLGGATLLIVLSFVAVPFFNRFGWLVLSRWWLLAACYADMFLLLSKFGLASGIQFATMPLVCLPMMLFGARYQKQALAASCLAPVAYLVAYLWAPAARVSPAVLSYLYPLFLVTVFGCLIAIVFRLVQASSEQENTLAGESQSKSDFLAGMSHELRVPLNTIIGYTEMMIEDADTGDLTPHDASSDLRHVHHSAQFLLELINDVLDLSKIEAGKMELHPEPTSLHAVVQDVERFLRPMAMVQGDQILNRVDPLFPAISIDTTKLRQCLLNLVGNALKFTKDGSVAVGVELSVIESDESANKHCLQIHVTDTGVGMSREALGKLFTSYTQVGEQPPQFKSTGLGLMITYNLCQLMGGEVLVESEVGTGTTFTMKLPVSLVPTT